MAGQQTHSTFIIYCRAIFIIVAVLSLPAIAVFWNAIPWPSKAVAQTNKHAVIDDEATSYRSLESKTDAPQELTNEKRPFPTPLNDTNLPLPTDTPPLPSPISQASYFTPPQSPVASATPAMPLPTRQIPANAAVIPMPVRAAAEPAYASQATSQEGFATLEEELKHLGAHFYRLQTWGSAGDLYRFSCYVGAPGNERYQKHFQAIDANPHRAMRQVIDEIKAWTPIAP